MPQDVHLDDINGDNNLTEHFCSSKLLFTFLRSGIVDFMYHGEVAVPTQDLSRFLTVAEQFQVRGLVEDVPKVGQRKYLCRPKKISVPRQLGAVPVSSSRYQSKRPRLLQEEDEPSVETVDQVSCDWST